MSGRWWTAGPYWENDPASFCCMAEMSPKFVEVGKELYVSESGQKREAID